jgi:hypothetical protein
VRSDARLVLLGALGAVVGLLAVVIILSAMP